MEVYDCFLSAGFCNDALEILMENFWEVDAGDIVSVASLSSLEAGFDFVSFTCFVCVL